MEDATVKSCIDRIDRFVGEASEWRNVLSTSLASIDRHVGDIDVSMQKLNGRIQANTNVTQENNLRITKLETLTDLRSQYATRDRDEFLKAVNEGIATSNKKHEKAEGRLWEIATKTGGIGTFGALIYLIGQSQGWW
jgi:hypothetical protein